MEVLLTTQPLSLLLFSLEMVEVSGVEDEEVSGASRSTVFPSDGPQSVSHPR